jgi:AcrR family transcriptional regulator
VSDRKRDILEAALRGFAEKGLAGTTVEEVRRRSGASVGSIYHHFGDKEGIAAALYVDLLRDYQAGVVAVLTSGRDAEATIKGLVRHHLRWVEADPERARFLLTGLPPRAAPELAGVNRRGLEATAAFLEREVAAGNLTEMPLDVFYAVLIGPAQEFCRHWLQGRMRTSLRAAERSLSAAAWRALGAGV